jgi:prepilin-type N-terminal cleavage/methylation domain-containing protein
MTRRLRAEHGMTLPEVLVVSLILVVVLGATLSVFETFEKTSGTNQRINDVQESVRVSVDSITREMRNLASPTNQLPEAILRAEPDDLMFLSVAGQRPTGSLNTRNTRAVRYCLTTAGRTLWRQELTWATADPPTFPNPSDCPGPGTPWVSQRVMASNVQNTERPVFTYNSDSLTSITEVAVSLFIDADPGRSPNEVALQSAVFLRNQNRLPVAEFDLQTQGSTFVLNGSASSDPEGRALSFYWYDEARTETTLCDPLPVGIPATGCVGKGLVFTYTPPALGPRTLHLIVTDPAGLQAEAPGQTECVGTPGVDC